MTKVVRLFDARNRAKLAVQHPTTPSGVMFDWGGVQFNLMPLTFGLLLDVTDILDTGASIIDQLKEAQMAAANGANPMNFADLAGEALKYVVRDAPQLVEKFRDHLAKSPGVVPADHPEDREVFSEWFMEQDAVGMLRAFLPKLREIVANRPLETRTPAVNAAEPSSEAQTATTST